MRHLLPIPAACAAVRPERPVFASCSGCPACSRTCPTRSKNLFVPILAQVQAQLTGCTRSRSRRRYGLPCNFSSRAQRSFGNCSSCAGQGAGLHLHVRPSDLGKIDTATRQTRSRTTKCYHYFRRRNIFRQLRPRRLAQPTLLVTTSCRFAFSTSFCHINLTTINLANPNTDCRLM